MGYLLRKHLSFINKTACLFFMSLIKTLQPQDFKELQLGVIYLRLNYFDELMILTELDYCTDQLGHGLWSIVDRSPKIIKMI